MLYSLLNLKYEKYVVQIIGLINILLILLFSHIKQFQNLCSFLLVLSFLLISSISMIIFSKTKSFKTLFSYILIFICLINIVFTFINPYNKSISINEKKLTFQAKVFSVKNDEILLITKYGKIKTYIYQNNLMPGMLIEGDFSLFRTSPKRNPGGFDEFNYYQTKGIYLKAEIAKESLNILSLNKGFDYYSFIIRSSIKEIYNEFLGKEQASLLAGILLGDKTGISKENKDSLYNAGLSHIIAVSGMVISIIVLPIKSLSKKLFTTIILRRSAIIAFLLLFGFIVGYTPSLSRAIIMVVFHVFAQFTKRKVTLFQTLSISVLIITLLKPEYILSIGFWLSASATLGIILFSKDFKIFLKKYNILPDLMISGIALTLSVLIVINPILYYMSGNFSLATILSNIIIVPILPIIVIIGLLLPISNIFGIFNVVLSILTFPLNGMLTYLLYISSVISKFKIINYDLGKYGIYLVTLFSILVILKIKKQYEIKLLLKSISLIIVIICISHIIFDAINKPDLIVVFADVGQGDCTLIITSDNDYFLIDSGSENKGENTVVPLLKYYNVDDNLTYINTHIHEDHCGAMPYIMSKIGGGKLYVPYFTVNDISENDDNKDFLHGKNLINAALNENIEIVEVGQGDKIKINENLYMEIFNPSKINYENREKGDNSSSLVIRIVYKNYSILIMGDATKEVEDKLLDKNYNINSNIYRISHHGSRTTTNHDIINKIKPNLAIISVGKNIYGHPSPDVVEKLQNSINTLYRTDENGAIIYSFKNNKVIEKTMLK